MKTFLDGSGFKLGTCYYPEQWPKEEWAGDLRRMKDHGIRIVRVGEFAWNLFEMEEGVYNFDFFDEFLEIASEIGMKVIFCTPTATPPAWLTRKYPEVLNQDINGHVYQHGARRHYNYNSPVYQEFSAKITQAILGHYGDKTCIVGWQIDNELNCQINEFYSEADRVAFGNFLKAKYGNLEELNRQWGTVFWNQTYTDWDQVDLPRTSVSQATNPHRVFDYIRFVSESTCRYAGIQAEIIKKYKKPGDFITTNGIFPYVDNHQLKRESLDFMTYDSYPNFAYCTKNHKRDKLDLMDRKWSINLSEVRSISPIFGIMEQQSGANGWNTGMEAPNPKPGQLTLWTIQSLAHGADFISYFRWRTATFGTEMYWHGILDYSGRDNRRLDEVKEVAMKLDAIREVAGSLCDADIALIKDYDNEWEMEWDVWHKSIGKASEKAIGQASQYSHTPMDIIYLNDDTDSNLLRGYKVVFYLHPGIMTDARIEILKNYVKEGGIVVFGARSGYKHRNGQCVRDRLPGKIKRLISVDIPEYTAIPSDDQAIYGTWDEAVIEPSVFIEDLHVEGDCELLSVIEEGDYKGMGLLAKQRLGKGTTYYLGSGFTYDSLRLLMDKLEVSRPYQEWLVLPKVCELVVRKHRKEDKDKIYFFVLNYDGNLCEINLKRPMINLYTGQKLDGPISLSAYETMVLKPLD